MASAREVASNVAQVAGATVTGIHCLDCAPYVENEPVGDAHLVLNVVMRSNYSDGEGVSPVRVHEGERAEDIAEACANGYGATFVRIEHMDGRPYLPADAEKPTPAARQR